MGNLKHKIEQQGSGLPGQVMEEVDVPADDHRECVFSTYLFQIGIFTLHKEEKTRDGDRCGYSFPPAAVLSRYLVKRGWVKPMPIAIALHNRAVIRENVTLVEQTGQCALSRP